MLHHHKGYWGLKRLENCWDTDGTYKTYDKFDDKYTRICINKDK